NHVSIAMGSGGELETCLELARRLGFLASAEAVSVIANCQSEGQILTRLHQALERKLEGVGQRKPRERQISRTPLAMSSKRSHEPRNPSPRTSSPESRVPSPESRVPSPELMHPPRHRQRRGVRAQPANRLLPHLVWR